MMDSLVGGTLLVGPRGTAKATAVRSLLKIIPRPFFPNIFWYNPVRLTGPTCGLPCRCGDLLKIN